jgi:hypothetical protein
LTVLVTGGVQLTDGCAFHGLSTAELYHPDAGGWTPVDPLGTARLFHTATLLGSGKVLVVGGETDTGAGTVGPPAPSFTIPPPGPGAPPSR